jgi:aryl-alcohol dehydrogenase-like predicted oxidoreductase
MDKQEVSRRRFMKNGAVTAAGMAGVAGALPSQHARAEDLDTSKIVNYNENMEYRRQGSTDWMVSAVCLGGHARSSQEERNEIVSRCLDAGINYIDACCRHEVLRDSRALKGRRDKMYLALSYCGKEAREEEYRTAKKLLGSLDELLLEAGEEYTDLWRITCFEPGGQHSFETSCEIVEALETAKKQGKARTVGFSSHDRRWIQFMIEYFPAIDCVCFPFTTLSKRAQTDSLFPALKKCDVGAFGIKPFAKGSLFTGEKEEDNRRARLALRYILLSDTVVPIPGINSIEQVENVVKAVTERRTLDIQEVSALQRANEQILARLPAHYQWLENWQYV